MLPTEVGTFGKWLATSPLADDRIWRRDVENIGSTELQLFYARAGFVGLKAEAAHAIDRLQSELILAGVRGEVPNAALQLIEHEPPTTRFDADEFIDRLVKLTPTRRAAVLYALATRSTPEQTVELTWLEINQAPQAPELVMDILKAQSKVRHMKLPYVFWEWASTRIAMPLINLQASAEQAFGMTWPAIQQRYASMLWISGRADSASFNSLVEEVAAGKL